MRIAFLTSQFQGTHGAEFSSGPANYLLRVSRSLVALGHHPVLISIAAEDTRFDDEGVSFVSVSGKQTGRMKRLGAGTMHIHSYMSRRLNSALAELHRKHPVDVVQYTNYRATALHRFPDIPAVMRVSSFRPLWDQPDSTGTVKWSRRVATRLERRSFHRVDALYAPSRLVADVVCNATGIPVSVIEPPFYPEAEQLDTEILHNIVKDRPYLLFVGSMTERKGLSVLAEVIRQVFERHPELLLLLAGRDKPYKGTSMVDNLRTAAAPFSDRVVYLGEVPHSKLYPLYPAARAVVLPSLMDNLPNSCLEAMALGSVVIGSDGASFEQLITDGSEGFLVVPGSSQSLIERLETALTLGPAQREAIGEAAVRRMNRMDPSVAIPELLGYYETVIRSVS